MELLNLIRWPLSWWIRLSLTLGALTSMVPAPHTTSRLLARPLRTTSARPSSSRSSLAASR
jgi:hypothetical protein